MNRSLNFAIVGCGRIAQRHAEIISKIGTLQCACDIVPKAAEDLAKRYNAQAYTSIGGMLKEERGVDVVTICSPNGFHAEHAIAALEAGCHVLCEKPMAIKVEDCEKMIRAADKAGKRLFIVKQNRFNPPVTELKRLIHEGRLGKILSAQLNCFWNRNNRYYQNSWKGSRELDGGTLFTQFSHFIDLLYWMIGDVDEVKAFSANYLHEGLIEFEDTGVVILKFKSGAIASINYTVNSYDKNMEGSLTVFGEKGTVKVGGQYLNELEYQAIENYTISNLPAGNKANNYGDYLGSMSNHEQVYQNVLEVLFENAAINTSAFEGMKTVEIISKIYNAAHQQ